MMMATFRAFVIFFEKKLLSFNTTEEDIMVIRRGWRFDPSLSRKVGERLHEEDRHGN